MELPIVTVNDLHKTYDDEEAVRGVSFQIAKGEIFGLLGPNGAGKTTTISMLTGLLEPTSGSVKMNGEDLTSNSNGLKSKIGFVPQELALYPTLSAYDNLIFFGRIYNLNGKVLKERVAEVLEIVGLTDRAKDRIDTYSGGMKRRINIAAGLLHQPEILFLDEPTVGVDPQSRNAIFESVGKLNRAGLTILYTTHYMEEADRLCNRVAIVDQGKIIALDTPNSLIRSMGGGLLKVGLLNGKLKSVQKESLKLSTIKDIQVQENQLIIRTTRAQEALVSVLEITSKLDATVTSLEILEPNLETVFIHLTGSKLRD
ncbi:MAG: ATP-binding cassette domain-containing protein [Chloroflexi bacterium]|jgi:ABC-2 type transport system ATP-binding protein|nr:ATP-binding cassette domain-containing protein [Chloroflexota bacterium]MBT3670361.1 ATP-binding cassette domain-containing protein [Chloroflexota bacterium]MBT4001925.1 ATP-binding cassette domain-containing protein [Chloroflexota bacterium]MBT4305548.1 ATP-binding cassette domain-containing protein [Chloroflexota bacterium]MBT4533160.1 ATP-binding cassette domain-containing protein [Chloroflexota bacterium]